MQRYPRVQWYVREGFLAEEIEQELNKDEAFKDRVWVSVYEPLEMGPRYGERPREVDDEPRPMRRTRRSRKRASQLELPWQESKV